MPQVPKTLTPEQIIYAPTREFPDVIEALHALFKAPTIILENEDFTVQQNAPPHVFALALRQGPAEISMGQLRELASWELQAWTLALTFFEGKRVLRVGIDDGVIFYIEASDADLQTAFASYLSSGA